MTSAYKITVGLWSRSQSYQNLEPKRVPVDKLSRKWTYDTKFMTMVGNNPSSLSPVCLFEEKKGSRQSHFYMGNYLFYFLWERYHLHTFIISSFSSRNLNLFTLRHHFLNIFQEDSLKWGKLNHIPFALQLITLDKQAYIAPVTGHN